MKTLLTTLILAFFLTGCFLRKTDKKKSDFSAETDDSENALSQNVVDTAHRFENYVNAKLKGLRLENSTKTPGGKDFINRESLVDSAFAAFGKEVSGTGYGIPGFLEVSQLVEVEHWFISQFDRTKNEILYVPWDKSKYRDTELGFLVSIKNMNPMLISKGIANRALHPVVRQNGVLIGLDKWGHYFDIGYKYFKHSETRLSKEKRDGMTRFLEGDPSMTAAEQEPYARIAKEMDFKYFFGVYGTRASGMYSLADGFANEAGFHFYNELFKNPAGYQFKLSDIDLSTFNEQLHPNINPSSAITISK